MVRKAYKIMSEWDREAGISPETRATCGVDYEDIAVDACNTGVGWDGPEEWMAALERGDVAAILAGRSTYKLPALV